MRAKRLVYWKPTVTLGVLLFELVSPCLSFAQSCLQSTACNTTSDEACTTDPLGLASQSYVAEAEKALRIYEVKIEFVGCRKTCFRVEPGGATMKSRFYRIYYPVLPGEKESYAAPIIHELGHVYQLEREGGLDKLQGKYQSREIELEADFFVGVLLVNYLGGANPSAFQESLNLIGSYRSVSPSDHGTPEQRTSAFRMGLKVPYKNFGRNIDAVDQHFHANVYGTLD